MTGKEFTANLPDLSAFCPNRDATKMRKGSGDTQTPCLEAVIYSPRSLFL